MSEDFYSIIMQRILAQCAGYVQKVGQSINCLLMYFGYHYCTYINDSFVIVKNKVMLPVFDIPDLPSHPVSE